jgi:two-component system sensor histidine kinase DesK
VTSGVGQSARLPQFDDDPDREHDAVRVDPRVWPTFERIGHRSQGRRRDRIGASLFLVFLVPNSVQAVHGGASPALVVGVGLAYAVAYLAVWFVAPGWSPSRRVTLVAGLFGLGVGYVVVTFPYSSPAVLGFALSALVVLLPLAWAQPLGMACIGGAVLAGWLVGGRLDWDAVLVLALILVITMTTTRLARLIDKLHAAHAEIRALAVAGERARLARDLHDVLGHSLTTITVKTSLARRLLERGAPPDRVLAEIRDTEELSRRALADIRATVSGERRMSLAAELVSARAALRAAGIEADLPTAVDDVAAPLAEPLAYVLREGVTNVVRHSGARRCTVRLGRHWLEVCDDGSADGSASARPPGNGLAGLAERMAAVGGTLTAGPLPGGGYRLRAEVPQGEDVVG